MRRLFINNRFFRWIIPKKDGAATVHALLSPQLGQRSARLAMAIIQPLPLSGAHDDLFYRDTRGSPRGIFLPQANHRPICVRARNNISRIVIAITYAQFIGKKSRFPAFYEIKSSLRSELCCPRRNVIGFTRSKKIGIALPLLESLSLSRRETASSSTEILSLARSGKPMTRDSAKSRSRHARSHTLTPGTERDTEFN